METVLTTVPAPVLRSKEYSAVLLDVSLATIDRMLKYGELTPIKVGRSTRIKQSELDAILNSTGQRS